MLIAVSTNPRRYFDLGHENRPLGVGSTSSDPKSFPQSKNISDTQMEVAPTTQQVDTTVETKAARRKYAQGRKTLFNWITKEAPYTIIPSGHAQSLTEVPTCVPAPLDVFSRVYNESGFVDADKPRGELAGMWVALNVGVQTGTTDFAFVRQACEQLTKQQQLVEEAPRTKEESGAQTGAKRQREIAYGETTGTFTTGRVYYSSRAPFCAVPVVFTSSPRNLENLASSGGSGTFILQRLPDPQRATNSPTPSDVPSTFLPTSSVHVAIVPKSINVGVDYVVLAWCPSINPNLQLVPFLRALDETPLIVRRATMPLFTPIAITHIPGAYIVPDFVSQSEEEAMLTETSALQENGGAAPGNGVPQSEVPKWSTMHRRDVLHFMRQYDYATNSVVEGASAHLPSFYGWMADRLEVGADSSSDAVPFSQWPIPKGMRCDQLTINRYTYNSIRPVSGISHHVDSHRSFGPVIFALSLAASTTMEFQRPTALEAAYQTSASDSSLRNEGVISVPQRRSQALLPVALTNGVVANDALSALLCRSIHRETVLLEPRSLLILTHEARYLWTHAIAERHVDIIHDGTCGRLHDVPRCIPRATRVSFTFRKARDAALEGSVAPGGINGWGEHSVGTCPHPCMCDALN